MAGNTEGFYIQRQEWHDQTEGGTGEETPQPGDKKIAFPVDEFGCRSHKFLLRKVEGYVCKSSQSCKAKKVSLVSMRLIIGGIN
ncbi:hypothetical protein D3C78_1154760 [compost metagenome]